MRITTRRLLLREYTPDDLPELLAYQGDARAREFYGPHEASPDRVRELLDTFIRWAAERPRAHYQLAITRSGGGGSPLIGSGGLREIGVRAGQAELGLELAPEWWGQGYATEAARALLDFGFRELGLSAVRGITVTANTRITAVVRKLGFRPVGTQDGPAWMRERGWSETEWRLTRRDWDALLSAAPR
jgi:RimJ/RimL family protein N-acetyltransferase